MCLIGPSHFSGVLLWVVFSTVEGVELGDRGHSENILAGKQGHRILALRALVIKSSSMTRALRWESFAVRMCMHIVELL